MEEYVRLMGMWVLTCWNNAANTETKSLTITIPDNPKEKDLTNIWNSKEIHRNVWKENTNMQ